MGLFGGGSKGQTTVTQDNEPPKWAAPLFQQSAREAQNLYNSGHGFNIYPGPTTAEPSRNTMLGMQGLTNVALDPMSYQLAQNPMQLSNQLFSQGGLMAPSHQAMGFYGDIASGGLNPSTRELEHTYQLAGQMSPEADALFKQFISGAGGSVGTFDDFRDIYGRAQLPGAAENYLTSTARGDYLEDGNPHFRSWLETEAERMGDQISGMMSGSGRFGSGAHTGVMGEEIGNFMTKGLSEDFARERALQMQAAQTMEAAQQGRLGHQLAAVHGMTGVGADDLNRQLQAAFAQRQFAGDDWQRQHAAAGDLFNAQQQNLANQFMGAQSAAGLSNEGIMNALNYIGALPTIQQNRLFAPQLLQQVGAQQDQANQAMINDMISRFYQHDMQDWTRLGALQAAAQGSAGDYGTTHRVMQQPPNYNPLFQLGGGLLSLMGGGMF
jgi:hypothetical protein